ncbi:hypothetical protein B1748_09125 [Paenibacillus sp. MY03]|uniref:hypothetical protein n=1 Tax=Paenibacillus sp. MY03 TaxID=302980 RepID=UPI000B3C3F70|nr:hypothetical protein [Paenibacillus sp. MY03]OUS77293.1 hypothetical protein B1748_09125 [Paenibacillus sp. MY03]
MQEKILEEIRDILKEILEVVKENRRTAILDEEEVSEGEERSNEKLEISIGDQINASATLFKRLVDVYYNEELKRIELNNVRKSSRRVSVELGKTLCDFLNHQLLGQGMKFERQPDGLVIASRGLDNVVAIKLITDMGFYRGSQWNEVASDIVDVCETKYGISNDRVFFIISSLRNGIDQGYVESLLGHEVKSNWEFLNNRQWVDSYVRKFIDTTHSLVNPRNQMYFMASEMHPNVVAEDLYKMSNEQMKEALLKIDEYTWISNLQDLINQL